MPPITFRIGRCGWPPPAAASPSKRNGGREGVKLEQQVLVTESGIEVLSRFPFEEALLG